MSGKTPSPEKNPSQPDLLERGLGGKEQPSDSFLMVMRDLGVGSEEAAKNIYNRYLDSVLRLAKRKLAPSLVAKVSPETIAQTAMFALLNGLSDGKYEVKNWASLYGLLARITIRKALNRNRFHHQKIRDDRKGPNGVDRPAPVSVGDYQPASMALGPAEEAEMNELVEHVLSQTDPDHRRILEIFLQDKSKDQTVIESGYSTRTVERILKEFRERLESLMRVE